MPLVPLPILEKVVGSGHDCEHGDDRPQQLERQGQGQCQEARNITTRKRFKSLAFRPHQHRQHAADQDQFDEALAEIGNRLFGKYALETGRR